MATAAVSPSVVAREAKNMQSRSKARLRKVLSAKYNDMKTQINLIIPRLLRKDCNGKAMLKLN